MKTPIRGLVALTASIALSSFLHAQPSGDSAPSDMPPPPPSGSDTPPPPPSSDGTTTASGATEQQRPRNRERMNFNPEEMRQRMLQTLRDQMGVTKDDEWALISQRIEAVQEARRSSGGGFGFGPLVVRAGGPGGGGGGGGRRGSSPEVDALRSAITDNLPAAEIQARLERLREARKANEAKVTKAQEDLRAVLNARQEAVAVLFGLLP